MRSVLRDTMGILAPRAAQMVAQHQDVIRIQDIAWAVNQGSMVMHVAKTAQRTVLVAIVSD